MEESELRKIC